MTNIQRFGAVAALSLLGITSCTESDTEETAEVTATITVELPEFPIPVGESFQCYYSDTITDKELSVVAASGKQVK
ncbi:MAG: hypothetical protein JNK04_06235, partial [Myxococcales bacterium]|nr:hypothetical protein [Myxococcales bacterium]